MQWWRVATPENEPLVDFQEAGMKVLGEIVRPPKFNWFGFRRPRRK
jgi:hypothetical protein